MATPAKTKPLRPRSVTGSGHFFCAHTHIHTYIQGGERSRQLRPGERAVFPVYRDSLSLSILSEEGKAAHHRGRGGTIFVPLLFKLVQRLQAPAQPSLTPVSPRSGPVTPRPVLLLFLLVLGRFGRSPGGPCQDSLEQLMRFLSKGCSWACARLPRGLFAGIQGE